jgi:autotransporter translocation and assembly factor TamB
MRRLRFWALAGLLILLLLAGTVVATWLAFRAYGPEFTRERIEAALSDALGRPARIEAVRLQPWLGRITLSNITVEAPIAGEPMLRLGRLEIRIGLSSLWRRQVVLSRVTVEELVVRLTPDGTTAPLRSLAVPTTILLGPVTVSLGPIHVIRGTLRYAAPGNGWQLEVRDIEGRAVPGADGVDISARAGALRFRHGRIDQTVETLEAAARIGDTRIAVERLALRWRGRPVRVAGELLPLGRPGTATLRVEGECDLAEVGRAVGAAVPVSGIADVRGEIAGDLTAPRIAGQVAVPLLGVGALRVRAVSLRGRWTDGLLKIEEARGHALDGEVRGTLVLAPDRLEASRWTLAVRQIGLAPLETLLERPLGLAGRLDGEVDLAGDPRRPESWGGRIAVESRELKLPGPFGRLGTGSASAAGRLEAGAVEVAAATARWPGGELAVRGGLTQAGPRALHVEGQVDLDRIALLWGQRGTAGRAAVSLVASGGWDRPEVAGQIRLGAFTIADTAMDAAEIPFRMIGSSVELDPTVRRGRIRLTGSGRLSWPSPLPSDGWHPERDLRFRIGLTAPQVPWEDLAAWLPEGARGQGQLAISASASGTPGGWSASADVRAASLRGPHAIPIQALDAQAILDAQRIELRSLRADVHGVPVRARGAGSWDGDGTLSLDLGPADLARLPWQAASDHVRGTGTAAVTVRLSRWAPEASGLATLHDANAWGIPLGSGTIAADLKDGRLRARLGFPQARLAADVAGPLTQGGMLSVRSRLEEGAIDPLVRRFAPDLATPVQGVVTAAADLVIPLADPAALRGSVILDPLRLVVAGEEWTNRGPVALRWAGEGLAVDRLEVAGRLGSLEAAGRTDTRGALDFTVKGRIPLAILPGLRPELLEAGGTLSVAAQIGGTGAAPSLRADLAVKDGLFRLRDYGEPVRQVEARAVLTTDALRLVEATAAVGRAQVRAEGTLTLVDGKPGSYRATVKAENAELSPIEGLKTTWNATLEVAGTGARPVVWGEGRLVRGTYTGDLSLLSLVMSDRQGKAAGAGPAIPIRIRLHLDDNLLVQANRSRLRVQGTLNLEGTTANPILLGRLEAREGRVLFRKYRWTVTSASARFDDPRRVNPVLDVVATARIKTYDVTMRLAGRADELDLRFSSQPPLPENRILSLVALGTADVPTGGAGATALMGEAMQLLVRDLLGEEGGRLGLDAIDLRAVEEKQQTQLQVGAQVSEDVRLIYSQTLSGTNKRLFRVEYQVVGPLLIAGEQDFEGHYGGDLFLRLRFR